MIDRGDVSMNRTVAGNEIKAVYEKGEGILQLRPAFVTRAFNQPGFRLKLHPSDYYAYGVKAGAVMERWFSSVNRARNNNPDRDDEGLSYVNGPCGEQFLLKDAVEYLAGDLIGEELQKKYGTWPIFAKFFDYRKPLYFHFHPGDEVARKVGCSAKPECYYFPPQLNNYVGDRPSTYFGFNPEVTKEQIREKLKQFGTNDTHMLTVSRAFDLEVGTGWYVPFGVLHAPGSLLTYEPQWSTDLNCVFENIVCDETYGERFLFDICPSDLPAQDRVDYVMNAVDWDKNYDPDFKQHYFRPPVVLPVSQEGLTEKWICYGNDYITAKEITLDPGSSATLIDRAAYGCVMVQGFGKFGTFDAEAVNLMHIGDITRDEYFVGKARAQEGVKLENKSRVEPMVILQHFGPDNAMPMSQEG